MIAAFSEVQPSESSSGSGTVRAESNGLSVYSTIPVRGELLYIDAEIGEVYSVEGGEIISVNEFVALGSDLPKLSPGNNEITYDNTITDLKIIPRWWEL